MVAVCTDEEMDAGVDAGVVAGAGVGVQAVVAGVPTTLRAQERPGPVPLNRSKVYCRHVLNRSYWTVSQQKL